MSRADDSTVLECGVDLFALVAQVADGTPAADPEHQEDCPYCQAALRRLRAADGALAALAGTRVDVPHGLARRVMAQLRRERGRIPIASGLTGVDTASDVVVIQIARRAARTVDGVLHCSVALEPVTADGGLSIELHLTAALGPSLPHLAAEVRARVCAELQALTGLLPERVSVTIDDVEPAG